MSNSKFDQTVNWCVVTPRSNQSNLHPRVKPAAMQEKSPKGQGSFASKGHFYPKTKFQEEVNYRKKYLNECSKTHRNANNFCQVLHPLIS